MTRFRRGYGNDNIAKCQSSGRMSRAADFGGETKRCVFLHMDEFLYFATATNDARARSFGIEQCTL
jgi:hypothetical protein